MSTRNGPADGTSWRRLYRVGAVAAIAVVALIPIQAAVFVAWPAPTTPAAVFSLFGESAVAGLLAFDLLLMGSWILSVLMFLGLYAALRHERGALISVAVLTELVAVGIYSPPTRPSRCSASASSMRSRPTMRTDLCSSPPDRRCWRSTRGRDST